MKGLRFFLFLVCQQLAAGFLSAQTPNYINYTVKDGLPTQTVYGIVQGPGGSMILGTSHGVWRFDGQTFSQVNSRDENKGLKSHAFKLRLGSGGKPWTNIMTSGIFEIGEFLEKSSHNQQIKIDGFHQLIDNFYVDSARKLYFLQRGYSRQVRTVSANGELDSIQCNGDHGDGHFLHLHRIGSTGRFIGFHCWPKGTKASKIENSHPESRARQTEYGWLVDVSGLYESHNVKTFASVMAWETDAHLWLGTGYLVMSHDLESGAETYQNTHATIISVDSLDRSRVAISFDEGILFSRSGESTLDHYLKGIVTTSCARDADGGTWISSISSGIYYMPNLSVYNLEHALINEGFSRWVGLDHEQRLLSFQSEGLVHFINGLSDSAVTFYPYNDFSSVARVFPAYGIQDQRMQVGNASLDMTTGHISAIADSFGVIGSIGFYNESLVGLTHRGVLDIKRNQLWEIPRGSGKRRRAMSGANDTLYIGSDDGVDILEVSTGKYIEDAIPLLSGRVVISLDLMHRDTLLVAADSCIYIMHGGQVDCFNARHNPAIDLWNTAYWQSDTSFWVTTMKGVVRVTLHKDGEYSFSNIGMREGLNPGSVSRIVHMGDTAVVGTEFGVQLIDMSTFRSDHQPPVARINSAQVNDSTLSLEKMIRLSPSERNLKFNYSIISFQPGRVIEYAYLLEGFQEDWVVSEDGNATYFNLPPGEYSFRAKARDKSGEWGPETAAIHIAVPAQFYERALFWVFLALLVVMLAAGLMFWFFKQQNERRKADWQYSNAQLQALGLQMNPHFLFNALNSVQALAYAKDHLKVNTFIGELSHMLRSMLQNSREPLVPLVQELESLERYLEMEMIRFENHPFSFQFEVDEKLNLDQIQVPPMLLQPIAENALWHGLLKKDGKRELKVSCVRYHGGFQLRITDNGPGYEAGKGSTRSDRPSISLENVRHRIELYNKLNYGQAEFLIQALKDEEAQIIGTEVVFTFQA